MSEAQTTTTLTPGARIGAWRILRLIASGGMGEVYEAENAISSSRRALKVIRASLLGDDDLRIRFVRETTIASQIKHPNVVEAWDPLIEGDLIVLPMELLEGETLRFAEGFEFGAGGRVHATVNMAQSGRLSKSTSISRSLAPSRGPRTPRCSRMSTTRAARV